MKKLLVIGVVLGLFLTSCHKKEHCKEEVEIVKCGFEDDHKDWGKDEYYDKDNTGAYYEDDLDDKDIYATDDIKEEKDWNKEDKKWWWKKKKGYDKDDCDDVYPKSKLDE